MSDNLPGLKHYLSHKIKEQVKVSEGEFYVDFGKYDYAFNFVLVEEREII